MGQGSGKNNWMKNCDFFFSSKWYIVSTGDSYYVLSHGWHFSKFAAYFFFFLLSGKLTNILITSLTMNFLLYFAFPPLFLPRYYFSRFIHFPRRLYHTSKLCDRFTHISSQHTLCIYYLQQTVNKITNRNV